MIKKFASTVLGSNKPKMTESLLDKIPFLEGVSREVLDNLANSVEKVTCERGEVIFKEGEPGDSFYFIVEGTARVTSKGEFIADLGVGGCFGEGALLVDNVRSATVTASEKSILLQLKRDSFDLFADRHRNVRFRLRQIHEKRRSEGIENSIERNLLQNAPFLSGAGGYLVNELAGLLQRKKFYSGDVLIREGEAGATFLLIEDGIVGINKGSEQIAELGPGACLGEGSLLSREPCSATVIALTETSCFLLEAGVFHAFLSRYPVFRKRLMQIHAERTKEG